ncbi:NADH-ubiquinone oxidoreductase-F iron-sulfur binding region domain-containing protein [Wukongibacter baidiensis]|uniref:NADH-ubiquinone oxidoreductase-F iron-sulfur binding region domain-containing protein n=1 Tax=Wukongibacter baidiensis TaxID=1723361 RepID=UPI003D7F93F5
MDSRINHSVNYSEDIDLYKRKFKLVLRNAGEKIKGDRLFEILQIDNPSKVSTLEGYYDENVKCDSLRNIGSMIELGNEIDTNSNDCTCIIDAAKTYLSFLNKELCGKCVTCREGYRMMHYIVESIAKGKGIERDIDILIDLCDTVKDSSPCVLGKTAHKPILTSIEYFKDEYMEHIVDKKCSAEICEELKSFQ